MTLLAIDTALEACSVAVVEDGCALAVRSQAMARGHQERLAPMVAEAMAEAGVPFYVLDRIVVTIGPGSFTGLRVGLAFAKAMALALQAPCVGVGTLEALAASAPAGTRRVAAVLDARRDHLYLQAFEGAVAITDASILTIEAARQQVIALGDRSETLLVGAGAHLLFPQPEAGTLQQVASMAIDPLALARVGAARAKPAGRPQPHYLRAPDARTLAERAAMARA